MCKDIRILCMLREIHKERGGKYKNKIIPKYVLLIQRIVVFINKYIRAHTYIILKMREEYDIISNFCDFEKENKYNTAVH